VTWAPILNGINPRNGKKRCQVIELKIVAFSGSLGRLSSETRFWVIVCRVRQLAKNVTRLMIGGLKGHGNCVPPRQMFLLRGGRTSAKALLQSVGTFERWRRN